MRNPAMETDWTKGFCLLLVEDDESNRLTLSSLLEDAGFAVHTAGSYTEASGLFKKEKPTKYDAVLLDQGLGDGYGTSLIPQVRRIMPDAKVVFVTGQDGMTDLPVDAVFPKGGHFDDLLAFLFKLFQQAPLGRP